MYIQYRKVNLDESTSLLQPARAASSGQTREQIVAAAAALLRTPEGIRGFSLEAVGKAAKVTRLTVYNQFGSRRACSRRYSTIGRSAAVCTGCPRPWRRPIQLSDCRS